MKYLNTILIIGIIIFLFIPKGQQLGGELGGVRTQSTGFSVIDGDYISIGSTSPLYELTIAPSSATPTMMIISASSTSYGTCKIDQDVSGAYWYTTRGTDGTETASTTNICN